MPGEGKRLTGILLGCWSRICCTSLQRSAVDSALSEARRCWSLPRLRLAVPEGRLRARPAPAPAPGAAGLTTLHPGTR